MSSTQTFEGRHVAAVDCEAIARAIFRASPEEIPALRRKPDEEAVPPALLRHADEQTVVGLAAVLRAIRRGGLDRSGFGGWSVLAAPRFLGRAAFERAFPEFRAEGAWGVSPHLIPAHSLHSPSGTISQVLGAHGPNLGVGGTIGGGREALLFASTLLQAGATPGVWLVLTGRVGEVDGSEAPGDYEALALALVLTLVPPRAGPRGARFSVTPDDLRLFDEAGDLDGIAAGWFRPGTLRVDEGRPGGAIPRPHYCPAGQAAPSDSGGPT